MLTRNQLVALPVTVKIKLYNQAKNRLGYSADDLVTDKEDVQAIKREFNHSIVFLQNPVKRFI